MKKILSIVLAAVMVFSLGVTAFAADEDAGSSIILPEFPTQTENAIYFATENTYVTAGNTYEIPVYMLSDYAVSSEGDILVGLVFTLAGNGYDYGYMTITDVRISDEVQALAGYNLVACGVDVGEPNSANVIFTTTDASILKSEKLVVAYVTVTVSEAYTGYNEDGTEMDCMLDILAAQYYYFDNAYINYGAYAPVEIWTPVVDDYAEQLECIDFGGAEEINGVYTSAGHLIVEPPVPTWGERLKAWAIDQAMKILTFFQGINEVLLGLLPTL